MDVPVGQSRLSEVLLRNELLAQTLRKNRVLKKDKSDAHIMAFKTIPRAISEARRKASFSLTEAHGVIVVPILNFIDKLEF